MLLPSMLGCDWLVGLLNLLLHTSLVFIYRWGFWIFYGIIFMYLFVWPWKACKAAANELAHLLDYIFRFFLLFGLRSLNYNFLLVMQLLNAYLRCFLVKATLCTHGLVCKLGGTDWLWNTFSHHYWPHYYLLVVHVFVVASFLAGLATNTFCSAYVGYL